MHLSLKTGATLSLVVAASVTGMMASSASIGVATSIGSFQVNASQVRGSSTLLDGSVIETAVWSSQLQMKNGAHVRLEAGSRAKVLEGRVILEKGLGELDSSSAYSVEAHSLQISNVGPNSVARVRITSPNQVVVAALRGPVRVSNGAGLLIANIAAGGSLSFDPQDGAAGPTKVTGCLSSREGKFVIVDDTTKLTMEVRGTVVEKEAGNRVQITGASAAGSPTVTGASQIVNVSELKRISKGGACSSKAGAGTAAAGTAAAGTAAAAAGTGAAAAGISTAATVAIVGGVAIAGTVGGLAASGALSGSSASSSPVQPISR